MQASFCPYCLKIVTSEICPYCGSNVNYTGNPMHLPVGTTLTGAHPYVLGVCRGQGGFGVTYIALDVITNVRVAIKEYFPTYCSGRTSGLTIQSYYGQEDPYEKGKERFLDEARMLQNLSDLKSVVKVVDFFEANNSAYLVMEFLDGCSLKDYVQHNGKMPAKQFLDQFRILLEDIEIMHQRGVIHRDIAPDNIMILPNGSMRLIDFGAARSYLGEKSMSVVVKKGFAPVEQHLRSGLSATTDVYAIAATVYFCLTGVIPPDSTERLYGTVQMQSPISLGAALTQEQEYALERALQVQPKDRTQTVAQLIAELYGELTVSRPEEKQVEEKKREEFVTEFDPENNPKSKEDKRNEGEDRKTSGRKPVVDNAGKKRIIIIAAATAAIAVLLCLVFVVPKISAYNKACDLLENGMYSQAISAFSDLGDYKDSREKAKLAIYRQGIELLNSGEYEKASEIFGAMGSFENSELKLKEVHYGYGDQLIRKGEYEKAIEVFSALGDYSDSAEKINEAQYGYGVQLIRKGEHEKAIEVFSALGDYSDSAEMINEARYQLALKSLEDKDYIGAIAVFEDLGNYESASEMVLEAKYCYAVENQSNAHETADTETGNNEVQTGPSETAQRIHTYLKQLVETDYKDSKSLYNELYSWKAKVVNFSDWASRVAAVGKYDIQGQANLRNGYAPYRVLEEISVRKFDDFNITFLITGPLYETVDLYAEYSWPNGASGIWEMNWNEKGHRSTVSAAWDSRITSGINFVCAGEVTVRVCIRETGECIGEHTMIVK